MSDQLASRLNEYYRDFNAGRIEFREYRYRRGLLLDSLLVAPEDLDESQQTLPREAVGQTLAAEASDDLESGGKETPTKTPGLRAPVVIGLAVVVGAVVVLAILPQNSGDDSDIDAMATAPTRSQPETVAATGSDTQSQDHSKAQELVDEFVAQRNWKPGSVADFQEAWGRLPAADRVRARGAPWFQPLAQALAQQIEIRSNVTSNSSNDPELNSLYGLSLRLGLVSNVPAGWSPPEDRPDVLPVSIEPAAAVAADVPAARTLPAAEASSDQENSASSDSEAESGARTAIAMTPPESRAPAQEEAVDAEVLVKETTELASAPTESDKPCSADQLKTRQRTCYDNVVEDSPGPLLRVLDAGEFTMGSDVLDDSPKRQVSIDQPFAISIYEITQGDFRLYCEQSGATCPPPAWEEDGMPMVNVSWQQAVEYCRWLSSQTGSSYRLPTNEEWEYAARAGTTTAFPYGDDLGPAQARYSSVIDYSKPLPVSDNTTQKNQFGLWHMIGNVEEWVGGATNSDDSRYIRGGSYQSARDELRSAAHKLLNKNEKNAQTGFRVVREL